VEEVQEGVLNWGVKLQLDEMIGLLIADLAGILGSSEVNGKAIKSHHVHQSHVNNRLHHSCIFPELFWNIGSTPGSGQPMAQRKLLCIARRRH